MPKIIWSDTFSVGNEEIDSQHKRWIDIFNTAFDRMMGDDVQSLSTLGIDAIEEMRQYAKMHFAFEEAYMEKIGYPDLEAHRKIHTAFHNKLERIRDAFNDDIRPLNSEVLKMIENWLVEHIVGEDGKYKRYTQST